MSADTFEVVAPSVAPEPVIVHVPHASPVIPADVRAGIELDDDELSEELRRITDHRTDVLAEGVDRYGATTFVNRTSRLVVDPERFPDPDREVMERQGMGAVYTATTDLRRLRAADGTERERLLQRYFTPYATAFAALVADHLDAHGRCTIVDLHSYPSERLPYELGGSQRPEVCIGTDPDHTPAWLRDLVVEVAHTHGLATADDTPFAGAYVPLDRYRRDDRVTAVMLEIRRDLYLDETAGHPHGGEVRVRGFVRDVVARLTRR